MRRLLSAIVVALACVPLGACPDGKPEVSAPPPVIHRVEVLGVRVPQRLRHCRAEPEPLADDATVGDIAPHHIDALAAGKDCRTKLGAVDRLLTAAEARVKRGER